MLQETKFNFRNSINVVAVYFVKWDTSISSTVCVSGFICFFSLSSLSRAERWITFALTLHSCNFSHLNVDRGNFLKILLPFFLSSPHTKRRRINDGTFNIGWLFYEYSNGASFHYISLSLSAVLPTVSLSVSLCVITIKNIAHFNSRWSTVSITIFNENTFLYFLLLLHNEQSPLSLHLTNCDF